MTDPLKDSAPDEARRPARLERRTAGLRPAPSNMTSEAPSPSAATPRRIVTSPQHGAADALNAPETTPHPEQPVDSPASSLLRPAKMPTSRTRAPATRPAASTKRLAGLRNGAHAETGVVVTRDAPSSSPTASKPNYPHRVQVDALDGQPTLAEASTSELREDDQTTRDEAGGADAFAADETLDSTDVGAFDVEEVVVQRRGKDLELVADVLAASEGQSATLGQAPRWDKAETGHDDGSGDERVEWREAPGRRESNETIIDLSDGAETSVLAGRLSRLPGSMPGDPRSVTFDLGNHGAAWRNDDVDPLDQVDEYLASQRLPTGVGEEAFENQDRADDQSSDREAAPPAALEQQHDVDADVPADAVTVRPSGFTVSHPDSTEQTPATTVQHGQERPAAGDVRDNLAEVETRDFKEAQFLPAVQDDETRAFVRSYHGGGLRDAAPVVPSNLGVPQRGWRGATTRISAGRVTPRLTRRELGQGQQQARIRTPLSSERHIAVISFGSGVGKTVTTGLLGQVFATQRDDSVAAIDADPVAGNLLRRFATQDNMALQFMLQENDRHRIDSVRQLNQYAARSLRLHLYRADHSRNAGPFGETEHARALEILLRFHDIVLTDMGPNGVHEMPKTFETVDDLIIVAGTNLDAAERSFEALDYLDELGHHELVRRANAVLVSRSSKDSSVARARRGGGVDVVTLVRAFQRRCNSATVAPYSAALADGLNVSLESVDTAVRDAYQEIAEQVAMGFQSRQILEQSETRNTSAVLAAGQPSQENAKENAVRSRRWWQRAHQPIPLPPRVVSSEPPSLDELPRFEDPRAGYRGTGE